MDLSKLRKTILFYTKNVFQYFNIGQHLLLDSLQNIFIVNIIHKHGEMYTFCIAYKSCFNIKQIIQNLVLLDKNMKKRTLPFTKDLYKSLLLLCSHFLPFFFWYFEQINIKAVLIITHS